jgi:hypothetical protein
MTPLVIATLAAFAATSPAPANPPNGYLFPDLPPPAQTPDDPPAPPFNARCAKLQNGCWREQPMPPRSPGIWLFPPFSGGGG